MIVIVELKRYLCRMSTKLNSPSKARPNSFVMVDRHSARHSVAESDMIEMMPNVYEFFPEMVDADTSKSSFTDKAVASTNPMASSNNPLHMKEGSSKSNSSTDPEPMKISDPLIFFDSIVAEFSMEIFIKQFFVHVFHPLLIWTVNADAQGFISYSIANIFLGYIQPILVYIMIISYALSIDQVLVGAIIFPLIFYVLHKIVVATKYACLSKSEYERFQSSKRPHAQRYRKQMELVSGWLRRDPLVLDFEIGAAFARQGLSTSSNLKVKIGPSMENTFMDMPENMKLWLDFFGNDFSGSSLRLPAFDPRSMSSMQSNAKQMRLSAITSDKNGSYVSVQDLCTAVVKRSDELEYYYTIFDRGCLLLAGMNTLSISFYFISELENT